MKEILQQINSVDGVIGSALCSHKGEVLAHAFPPLIDADSLKKVAALTMDYSNGLQIAQTLDTMELRYSDGRVLVKALPEAMLLLMCANSINLQVLSITLNLAIKKLKTKLLGDISERPAAPAVEAAGSGGDVLQIKIGHLADKQVSASFDSLGMVAVSQPTYHYISDFYKVPFKKLVLTNAVAGTSGTFPVMVMKDMDMQYNDIIVIGPGIEKKLKVSEGDKVEAKIG